MDLKDRMWATPALKPYCPPLTDGARVRAAGLLLSEARAWRSDDIEERLTALENAQPRHLIAVPN